MFCGCARNTACVCCFATVWLFNFGNGAFTHSAEEYTEENPVLKLQVTHTHTHTHMNSLSKHTRTEANQIVLADETVFKKILSRIQSHICMHPFTRTLMKNILQSDWNVTYAAEVVTSSQVNIEEPSTIIVLDTYTHVKIAITESNICKRRCAHT